jgi:hypothetical protein
LVLTVAGLGLPAAPAADAQAVQNITAVLVIDNSGSMDTTDPSGLRFVAATQLVDLLQDGDEIAVILFADESEVLVPLTRVTDEAGRTSIKQALEPVGTTGHTNMRAGLQASLAEARAGSNDVRFTIFLTDGQLFPPGWDEYSTIERDAEIQAIFNLAAVYGASDLGIFPVSLESAADPEFLQTLADNSGGLYMEAPEAADLTLTFQEIFAANKLDDFQALFSDCLAADQKRSVTFSVHPFVADLSLFVTYPGALRPQVSVTAPGGDEVSPTGTDSRYDSYNIDSPGTGTWTVSIRGSADGQSCATISSTPTSLVEIEWLQPSRAASVEPGQPLEISVRLSARDPQSDDRSPLDDATVTVTVTDPDSHARVSGLQNAGSGEYAGGVVIDDVPGAYTIDLVVESGGALVARRSLDVAVSFDSPATETPFVYGPSEPSNGGGGSFLLFIVLGPFLAVGLAVSFATYSHYGRPILKGFLESIPPGKAFDLQSRHSRCWWRRPLTIGGSQDDIDLGLERRLARFIPGRGGKLLVQALADGEVAVGDQPMRQGERRPLYHRAELSLGGVKLLYRLYVGGPRTSV